MPFCPRQTPGTFDDPWDVVRRQPKSLMFVEFGILKGGKTGGNCSVRNFHSFLASHLAKLRARTVQIICHIAIIPIS